MKTKIFTITIIILSFVMSFTSCDKDFLEKSMFAMDGKSSMRVEEAIIDAIEERK